MALAEIVIRKVERDSGAEGSTPEANGVRIPTSPALKPTLDKDSKDRPDRQVLGK